MVFWYLLQYNHTCYHLKVLRVERREVSLLITIVHLRYQFLILLDFRPPLVSLEFQIHNTLWEFKQHRLVRLHYQIQSTLKLTHRGSRMQSQLTLVQLQETPVWRGLLVTILLLPLLLASKVDAHGLSPSRLQANSGAPAIVYKFTAVNYYKNSEIFEVECFKENIMQPYECKSIPNKFWIAPNATKKFKVQIIPDSDAVYLVCTTQVAQTPEQNILTRVCSRFGVGVSPSLSTDKSGNGQPANGTTVPPRTGQNKGN